MYRPSRVPKFNPVFTICQAKYSLYAKLFTARVAKRAKVMFSQVCVTHSVQLWGGGRWCPPPPVYHLPPWPGHNTSPLGQVITPPSPQPGHNTSLPLPPSQVTTPPSPLGQVITPPSPQPGHNTSLPPPPSQVTTPPSPWPGHNTSPPPGHYAQAGRYASYWNAFLFYFIFSKLDHQWHMNVNRGLPSLPKY